MAVVMAAVMAMVTAILWAIITMARRMDGRVGARSVGDITAVPRGCGSRAAAEPTIYQ